MGGVDGLSITCSDDLDKRRLNRSDAIVFVTNDKLHEIERIDVVPPASCLLLLALL
jgi:hypothetical protein